MNDWMRLLKGVNRAAIRRVEATTARVDFSPVSRTKSLCSLCERERPGEIYQQSTGHGRRSQVGSTDGAGQGYGDISFKPFTSKPMPRDRSTGRCNTWT